MSIFCVLGVTDFVCAEYRGRLGLVFLAGGRPLLATIIGAEVSTDDEPVLHRLVVMWYIGCRYSDRTRSACLREGQYQHTLATTLLLCPLLGPGAGGAREGSGSA